MNDMMEAIAPKSDQLNADDLIGGDLTIRISRVEIRLGTEQPVSIFFDGDGGRPWKPCKSMGRVLVAAWGPDTKAYTGRRATLYRDPSVKWGGMEVGGIRISHMSDIEHELTLALTVTKAKRAPHRVQVLPDQPTVPDAAREVADIIISRMASVETTDGLRAATADAGVVKQRAALRQRRPELAAEVDAAVEAAMRRVSADDDFPGDRA